MEQNLGQIVIASFLDSVDDKLYKILASIETGSLAGNECFVGYRGSPNLQSKNLVIRLDYPSRYRSNLDIEDSVVGYFISSKIPDDFETGSSKETIFYGTWQDRMKQGFSVPIMGKIANYYDPGIMVSSLHYSSSNGFIIPYNLFKFKPPHIMDREDGRIRPLGNALRKYLSKMNRKTEGKNFPRIVTIDETIDFGNLIFPEFIKTELKYIEMEPQQ